MTEKNEIFWLCENAKSLQDQYAGRWVMIDIKEGVVSCGESLDKLMKMVRKQKKMKKPFIFHVPTKDELGGESFLSAQKN